MPILGLGTWHHGKEKGEMARAMRFAIKNGYRHIDCAHIYLNEEELGEEFGQIIGQDIQREELFIAGKLWCTHHEPERVEEGCRKSLEALNLDYFDLYYIHWPAAFEYGDENLPKDENGRVRHIDVNPLETWKAMEELVKKGLVKAIGICNFNTKQIKDLMVNSNTKPAVLQVESNPRMQNEILRKFCQKHDIAMIGFSSFGSPDLPWGEKLPHILIDPILMSLAEKHKRSTALCVLRWQIQRGVGVIPKSVLESELLENLKVFEMELDDDDMRQIETMDQNIRKIVPIVTLKDGTVELRDLHNKHNGFEYEETEEEALA